MVWGIHPNMLQTSSADIDEMIDDFIKKGVEDGIVQKGEKVVIIMGYPAGVPGSTNLLRVVRDLNVLKHNFRVLFPKR